MSKIHYKYDRNGIKIFCPICKSKSFIDNHHPSQCRACYSCGSWKHLRGTCLKNPKFWTPIPVIDRRRPFYNNDDMSLSRYSYRDNRHLLQPDEPVSIDLECVMGYGKNLPGFVVVCRYRIHDKFQQKIVFATKIRQRSTDISNLLTPISGLQLLDLSEGAMELAQVQTILKQLLVNRLVVGIGLKGDFQNLGLGEFFPQLNCFEFNDVFRDDEDKPIALRHLAFAFFMKRIQGLALNYDKLRGHDPLTDALMTMKIYRAYKNFPNAYGPLVENAFKPTHQWVRNLVEFAISEGQIVDNTEEIKKSFKRKRR